ncbi:MAG TPA: TrbG/VirB9 family P-type conjugative transfer protein [Candidatus Megaira endosymbiont of Hartmannula sinica]|nr:TrbG/VirB9 family P-type conjugative transfer protein [Candidatus Megaera endosymbiont of Hartmannula sinica]
MVSKNIYSYNEECAQIDLPLSTDIRIKNYIYNPNNVYLFVLAYGFQSQIEFEKSERIKNIILGDGFFWKITPIGNKLFIKPLEKNIRTNMTIITNKRSYYFDLISKSKDSLHDVTYLMKFSYPQKLLNNY